MVALNLDALDEIGGEGTDIDLAGSALSALQIVLLPLVALSRNQAEG